MGFYLISNISFSEPLGHLVYSARYSYVATTENMSTNKLHSNSNKHDHIE